MKEILDFFRDLRRNNDREWFAAHRQRYLEVKARCDLFAARMIDVVARVDDRAAAMTVPQCTYRIYRDTRFSPDKSPYKTHFGVFVNPPHGKKSLTMGYYFHLEPDNCFMAGGTVCLPSRLVTQLRQAIRDNIEEYLEIVRSEEFMRLYPHYGENPVKTAPKGFDRDWPYLELVRPRDFVIATGPMNRLFGKFLSTKADVLNNAADELLPYVQEAQKFNDFMNYTIEDYEDR